MLTVLFIVLIVLLLGGGAYGRSGDNRHYAMGGIGLGGILLIVLIALLLSGRI